MPQPRLRPSPNLEQGADLSEAVTGTAGRDTGVRKPEEDLVLEDRLLHTLIRVTTLSRRSKSQPKDYTLRYR